MVACQWGYSMGVLSWGIELNAGVNWWYKMVALKGGIKWCYHMVVLSVGIIWWFKIVSSIVILIGAIK